MKSMGQLLLIAVPLLSVATFFVVMKRWGGIAPQPPVPEMTAEFDVTTPTRTAVRQPTVLAPEPMTEWTFPPGLSPRDYVGEHKLIIANDMTPAATNRTPEKSAASDAADQPLLPELTPLTPPLN